MNLSPAQTPPQVYRPLLRSEFLVSVHAARAAQSRGDDDESYYQAKVAEQVLTSALPLFAQDIRYVGSRKGPSGQIGSFVGARLGGPTAAALAVLWWIRSARFAGIQAVFRTSARKPGFGRTLVKLLGKEETDWFVSRFWFGRVQP